MKWRNSRNAYGLIGIVTHWVLAVAIVALFVSGLWMVDLTYYHPWYNRAPDLHKAFGVLTAVAMAVRLLWRWWDGVPEPAAGVRRWEAAGASVAHGLMYLGVFVTAISGYLIVTAKGDPVDVFGVVAIPAVIHDLPRQADTAGAVHYWVAIALIALAGLHTMAALKHHVLDRDETLIRMLRAGRTERTSPSSVTSYRSEKRRSS
ncbi:MAG: cytochrome b [Rhodospirillales bacterium]|nr:cytochrome b [Rhodospirillales bacterium]